MIFLRRSSDLSVRYCADDPFWRARNAEGIRKYPEIIKKISLAQQPSRLMNPQNARIGEGCERCIFRNAGADGLEGPLKRVEYGDPGDRD